MNPLPSADLGVDGTPVGAVTVTSNVGRRCTGHLLSNSWVLTARSCLDGAVGALVRLAPRRGAPPQTVASVEILRHPYSGYDVALLRLSPPLTVNDTTTGLEMNINPSAPATLVGGFVTCRGQGGAPDTPWEVRSVPVISEAGGHLTVGRNAMGEITRGDPLGAGCFVSLADGRPVLVGVVTACDRPASPQSCTLLSAAAIRHWIPEARMEVDLVASNARCLQAHRNNGAPDASGWMEHDVCRHGSPNQRWRLLPLTTGNYRIHSVESYPGAATRCLLPRGMEEGAAIEQGDCDGGARAAELEWTLIPADGRGLVIRNASTGKCLGIPGAGNEVQQLVCDGQPDQRFDVIVHVGDGAHWLWQWQAMLCGDITGASAAAGAKLQQEVCSGATHQLFWFEEAATYGDLHIHPRHSNRCLELPAPELLLDRAILQQADCTGGLNQKFRLEFRPASFRIVSPTTGKCFHIPGQSISPGTKVQQATCHDNTDQRWRLAL